MTIPEFKAFSKIPRLKRTVWVTEKIDGTNGIVHVSEDKSIVTAGSRNRWLTVESDNFGFAAWVKANEEELRQLGPGYHYGEFWGAGIQRRYGLTEKRFSLFNASRWGKSRPLCCDVVPVLGVGEDMGELVRDAIAQLREFGSVAAPGFMDPEGVVAFHGASGQMFKTTLRGDEKPKGSVEAA